jgi:hypothetical protein
VKSFCEDKGITLRSSLVDENKPVWTLMFVKKKGKKFELEAELLAPSDYTLTKLTGKPFNKLKNYLSEDGARKVLLIGMCR